jgi:hypothetical protein
MINGFASNNGPANFTIIDLLINTYGTLKENMSMVRFRSIPE